MKATGKPEHNAFLRHTFKGESPLDWVLPDLCGFPGALPIEHPMVMAYIASCEPDHRLIYVSPQIANLGFAPEAWLAETDLRLQQIHVGDFEHVSQSLRRSRSTGEKFNCYYRFYDSSGKIHWLHDEASVVRDEAGMPLFTSGVMLDITEKKEMEAELHEHRYCLERQIEQRTGQLLKRMALLESCNASLSSKLASAYKELAELRQTIRVCAVQPEEVSDWAHSMIVWRVAAAGEIS